MKIECEVTNIRTSKKGDTLTIFIAKEHREHVVKHVMPFIEKPVTLELLIDSKKVLEDMDRINDDQRKKAYKLINQFATEYGDTPENAKQMLKDMFKVSSGKDVSLSDCDKKTASEFIEYVLSTALSLGYTFASAPANKTLQIDFDAKRCFVCKQPGSHFKNSEGSICLCEKHVKELQSVGHKVFMTVYHLDLV